MDDDLLSEPKKKPKARLFVELTHNDIYWIQTTLRRYIMGDANFEQMRKCIEIWDRLEVERKKK